MNSKRLPPPTVISAAEAAAYLTGHHGLNANSLLPGEASLVPLLEQLKCIQLDPLNAIGTNADLVALARLDGIRLGDIYRAIYPGYAFEHFAKERCILPCSAFPWYRDRAAETPWWRLSERLRRLPKGILRAVLDEIKNRGPVSARELLHRGAVNPIDWSGWKGTSSATRMALEVLWTRCQVVVCGRQGNNKLFDIPERALSRVAHLPSGDFDRWALLTRVEAAGLLSLAGGPVWSMLSHIRMSDLPTALLRSGDLERVVVEGSSREYLAPRAFRRRQYPPYDGRIRILGPLDPLIWDRALVRQAFGFEYVWEVYKPRRARRWGWYVCPLLKAGKIIGRIEGELGKGKLKITHVWRESGTTFDNDALDAALARHAEACGAMGVERPKRILLKSS